jgi:hypothetical protein
MPSTSPEAWSAYNRLKALEEELKQGKEPFVTRREGAVIQHYIGMAKGIPAKVDPKMLDPEWPSKAFAALKAEWLKQLKVCLRFENQ